MVAPDAWPCQAVGQRERVEQAIKAFEAALADERDADLEAAEAASDDDV